MDRLPSGLLGPSDNQANRPDYVRGKLNFAGQQYDFGSGGGGYSSIPFGNYPVTPGAIGPWGAAHGAIGINGNAIPDAKLGRTRQGIELHAGTNPDLITQGCIAIAGSQWRQFREQVMAKISNGEKLFLHVGPDGAQINNGNGSFGAEAPKPVQTTAVQGAPQAPQQFGDAPQMPPGLLAIPGMP